MCTKFPDSFFSYSENIIIRHITILKIQFVKELVFYTSFMWFIIVLFPTAYRFCFLKMPKIIMILRNTRNLNVLLSQIQKYIARIMYWCKIMRKIIKKFFKVVLHRFSDKNYTIISQKFNHLHNISVLYIEIVNNKKINKSHKCNYHLTNLYRFIQCPSSDK